LKKNTEIGPFKQKSGTVSWSSPSNIALVKYWGKKGRQFPANPSVSMTLNKSVTEMQMAFHEKEDNSPVSLEFYFEGKKNPLFEEKIRKFLNGLPESYSWLSRLHLNIKSRNSFPHSAGIASSASSMSALALCLLSIRSMIFGDDENKEEFARQASGLARQASGSASRSVYGGYAVWGYSSHIEGSDDRYAIPFPFETDPVFHDMRDAILLVNSSTKSVSSRAGHGLMDVHPFAEARYSMAERNTVELVQAMRSGDMDAFIRITEQEALTLHSLMMSSADPFFLLQPNSLEIIEKIWQLRATENIPVCFTIDAGPNIHLLYPGSHDKYLKEWIKAELLSYTENKKWIEDGIGNGPQERLK
jgi:diphosphomevalonate decarboxylase